MSKTSKEQRSKTKRDARRAQKALYSTQAGEKKLKKTQNRMGRFNALKHAHVVHNCGNAGCERCHPRQLRTPRSVATLPVSESPPGTIYYDLISSGSRHGQTALAGKAFSDALLPHCHDGGVKAAVQSKRKRAEDGGYLSELCPIYVIGKFVTTGATNQYGAHLANLVETTGTWASRRNEIRWINQKVK